MGGFFEHRSAMRALRRERETSAGAFYRGVLRHHVLARRRIWIGSHTVLEGADRITVREGGALLINLFPFGLTSRDDVARADSRSGLDHRPFADARPHEHEGSRPDPHAIVYAHGRHAPTRRAVAFDGVEVVVRGTCPRSPSRRPPPAWSAGPIRGGEVS